MTTFAERPTISTLPPLPAKKGKAFVKWITSTDHKTIGYLYLATSFAWFLIGGVLALALRSELARPGNVSTKNLAFKNTSPLDI